MITREILHAGLNKVYSVSGEIVEDHFQSLNESEIISHGYVFVKNYIVPFDKSTDELYIIEALFLNDYYSDFKQAREIMKAKALEIGFENLVYEQIELLAKWNAVPSTILLDYFDLIKLSSLSEFFDTNSKIAREKRLNCVVRYLRNIIPVSQLFPIIDKINGMRSAYIIYGIEGSFVENINGVFDPTGIYDYINSNSIFVENGFGEEDIAPNGGFSIVQVKEKIMDILQNGNYI